jgi:hypothetical protein
VVLRVRLTTGEVGEMVPLAVAAAWADPAADVRLTQDISVVPLAVAALATVASLPADPLVAERAALHLAAAERREALKLDRAGRHAESRARMASGALLLRKAPRTAAVVEDLAITMQYAEASPSAPLSEFERKQGAWWNARRNRGKED